MLFSERDPDHRHNAIRIIRDVVEIVAILAAGFWAFYVFVYENRIKPSFTEPQINIGATMQKSSQRAGAVGVLLKTDVRNVGTVRFYFVGYSVTVLGSRLMLSTRVLPPEGSDWSEVTHTSFTLSKPVAVYGFGFITGLGNPSSPMGGQLEPAGSLEEEHTFYIPARRFDLLTAHVDACFAKYNNRTIPSRLVFRKGGVATVTCKGAIHVGYDVGSLDLR